MNKKKPKKKTEPYNYWMDATAPDETFDHAEFMKRLKDVHGIDATVTKGKRRMQMHIDGEDFFSYVWEWEIGGKTFTQCTCALRRGLNKHIWADKGN